MGFFNPNQTSSIADIIKFGKKLDHSHSKFHQKTKFVDNNGDTIIMNYSSIFDKYFDLLKKNTQIVVLTPEEQMQYRFQPKRMSLDLYDTTELWSSLMRINNITSITQFEMEEMRVFTDDIFDIIDEIIVLEESNIKNNTEQIYG